MCAVYQGSGVRTADLEPVPETMLGDFGEQSCSKGAWTVFEMTVITKGSWFAASCDFIPHGLICDVQDYYTWLLKYL